MNVEEFRDYCLSLPDTSEDMPFDDKVLAFRVHGKIFVLSDIFEFNSINLKCDPEWAVELRERHSFIRPGYHMNKKHWNTIDLTEECGDDFLKELIGHSYECVRKTLPKKLQ
ncbi:MmcQ/YjbR family DNA-binding protein [Marinigracilibium pacificum]|uniref:MmcQ/YjbR family DNA-binding protein n=1 Tax=Marinigracilibium pacificum TaxID=2729599 RepID=A0A848J4D0_9BACT|nr:MmcQ/YjbR family DNA-binding protein [Marinigracilibium pacificum]NMM50576.1 MmcQ/YjbR family DNA-binding protein [Marinigracilibium pacificum]